MKSHLETLGRLRLQALLILGVVFVIGALAGAAFERAGFGRPERRGGPPPDHMRGLPPHLRGKLDLQPEQARRIDQLLERNRERTDAVLDQYLPQLRALTDSLRVEVRAELTPAQREVFDRLEKEPPPRPPHGRHGPHDRDGDRGDDRGGPRDGGPPPFGDDGPPPSRP